MSNASPVASPLLNLNLAAFTPEQIKQLTEAFYQIAKGANNAVNALTPYMAAPDPIGSTTPASGKFTTLEATGAAKMDSTLEVVGVLTLDTAVATPANGQVDAGDAAWIVVGAVGAPAYVNSFAGTCQFRKLPSGLVVIEGTLTTGVSGNTAFTLPASYRPALALNLTVPDIGGLTTLGDLAISTAGVVKPTFGVAGGVTICNVFYAEQ